jgi:hypothetical protein
MMVAQFIDAFEDAASDTLVGDQAITLPRRHGY